MEKELREILPGSRILTSILDRIAWASDASFYRAVPQAVVFPTSVEEIQALFRFSAISRVPLTFRASGTSLSGQAVGEGILVSLTRGWRRCEILEDGNQIRLEPGVIGEHANRLLSRFQRKIGPDPASIESARMGGILANNSSGMCCGVARNAYHTLRAMRFVLPSGLLINTSNPDADRILSDRAPELARELSVIRKEILANAELANRIREKHRIKNTMGYGLNAFLDFETPVEILSHLLIGSEGTLGFIAEATLETIPESHFKATALLTFESIESACAKIPEIERAGAQAIELLDRASLRSVGYPKLPVGSAALLVEFHFASDSERAKKLPELKTLLLDRIETDPDEQARLWKIRKGIFPAIASRRAPGTSVIIEDVAVPLSRLPQAVHDLREILDRNGYSDGVIFGHAKDGNLHFVITQAFDSPDEVRRYARFMEELATCIGVLHGGSLKAEHGTGRNMAPFVELEWGREAYALMKRIKLAVDPAGLLNPGVILSEDSQAHLKDLKSLPSIDPETDRCTECGYCEPRCPSRDLTLTPRQRIAIRREMARSTREPDTLAELGRAFEYAGLQTCAADGSCATACPVSIDTGALVKRLRGETHQELSHTLAAVTARGFWFVEKFATLALSLGFLAKRWIGDAGLLRLSRYWSPLFRKTTLLPRSGQGGAPDYVYFPSCVNRVIGGNLPATVVEVAKRAGKKAVIPSGVRGICCGTPFGSKGFARAREISEQRAIRALWKSSRQGAVPVILDQSPCAMALKSALACEAAKRPELRGLRILDSVEAAEELLSSLRVRKKAARIALHPVCSTEKMGLSRKFEKLAGLCAEQVYVPISSACCGFAGDLGLSTPELTESATREIARELQECSSEQTFSGCYSTSTTCELALTRATGKSYQSIWHLLEQISR